MAGEKLLSRLHLQNLVNFTVAKAPSPIRNTTKNSLLTTSPMNGLIKYHRDSSYCDMTAKTISSTDSSEEKTCSEEHKPLIMMDSLHIRRSFGSKKHSRDYNDGDNSSVGSFDSTSCDSFGEPDIDDTEASSVSLHWATSKVRFGNIDVVEMDMTMGNHPQCKEGPAVQLSSKVRSRRHFKVSEYELIKPSPRTRCQLYLSPQQRRQIIRGAVESAILDLSNQDGPSVTNDMKDQNKYPSIDSQTIGVSLHPRSPDTFGTMEKVVPRASSKEVAAHPPIFQDTPPTQNFRKRNDIVSTT